MTEITKKPSYPRDVLLKAMWKDCNLDELHLIILSRGSHGDTASVSGKSIEHLGRSYFEVSNGTLIPYHRILEIRSGEEIIWSRISVKSRDQ